MKQSEGCVICLEPLEDDEIKTLSCMHVYHVKCIQLWKEKKGTCPVCRNDSNHFLPAFSFNTFSGNTYGNLEPGFGSIDFTYAYNQIWRCLRTWRRRRRRRTNHED